LREIPESYLQDNRIWRFKGWLEKSQGQLQQAEKSYQQSLIIHPADWRSQVQLSEVYRLTAKPEKGKKLAELGSEGKELESIIMALPSVDSVPVELALRMADYFEASGDTPTAELMRVRIS
jgi:tetratricopeptide (TPR) repeat protein